MFADIAAPIVSLLNSLMEPLLLIVGALGSLYCVILGVKYAKAEEPQDREKAKGSLKNAVVGFVLILCIKYFLLGNDISRRKFLWKHYKKFCWLLQ